MTERQLLGRVFLVITSAMAWAAYSNASEPIRIWVDATGRYSVEASLVRREADWVILRRKDGGQSSMPFDRISSRDQEYLLDYEKRQAEIAAVEASKPESMRRAIDPIKIEPQEPLDLRPASFVAAENSTLQVGVVTETTLHVSKPNSQPADPSPYPVTLPLSRLAIDNINPYDRCSNLVSVGTPNDPAVGMSVTVGFALSGSKLTNRIVKFDFTENKTKVIYQSEEPVTLLDHHPGSRQSLVLVDHSTSGQGGGLAIATGWRSDEFQLNYQRRLPGDNQSDDVMSRNRPTLRWARWIDDEHIVAILDRSLIGWNLVSGEMIFRIDGIETKSTPALSGGRRYLALPIAGGVQLYETQGGKSLGRIAVEPRVVPAVGFSAQGNSLAIASRRRLIAWNLLDATQTLQFDSSHSLGSNAPTWVDTDLILTSSGMLVSVQRRAAVWRYHLSGSKTLAADNKIALFRTRSTELTTVKMPHEGADNAIAWLDSQAIAKQDNLSHLLGRSVWDRGSWQDRDVRVSSSGNAGLK
jgi:hypothetical protein